MISMPVARRLTIDGYGLYPGTEDQPGLQADFGAGLTLVLGANGLGKTTLITILYRMLTGPVDIPNLAAGVEFGNRRPEVKNLPRPESRVFAARVVDDAERAKATLHFSLGDKLLKITRRLKDLELTGLDLEGESYIAAEESDYRSLVQDYANLSSFADWVLLLRYLTFYFEDRRALVWDASAQRQLLRLLFLDRETSSAQTEKEREILVLDSSVRNQQYALGREERRAARTEATLTGADEVRQKLEILERVQEDEQRRLRQLDDSLVALEGDRQRARVNALTSDQAHESAMRAVERHQLAAIRSAFPSASQTAEYLIGQIMADDTCLVCHSDIPDFAADLRERVTQHRCIICDSELPEEPVSDRRASRALTKALKELQTAETQSNATAAERAAAESAYDELVTAIAELNSKTATRSADIDLLVRRLPPDEKAVHQQRSYLSMMQGRIAVDRQELEGLRERFRTFADQINQEIATRKEDVKTAFDEFAKGFLVEGCELVWSPRRMRLGESGALIEFAAFELNMTGAGFQSAVRRTGPEQVSESQREFIDLAFRMALMKVASAEGSTMVIDAPESSLDAVFVSRAATVLTRFGSSESQNRLIITSNLIDGDLIPQLLRQSNIRNRQSRRVIDLLEIAAPTAATAQLHDQYDDVRKRLFERAWSQ